MRRSLVVVSFVASIGCGPGQAEDAGTSSETSTGDEAPGDGDGDPSTGDGDGDPSSGDGDGDPSSGDGDGDCTQEEALCPDGTCQFNLGAPFTCCGHGGTCSEDCAPQSASSIDDTCDEPQYAWTGIECAAICGCEGADCGSLYASVGACLEDHEPACGTIGLDTCPFETPVGPTMVSGTTNYGAITFSFGAFGLIYGEGSPTAAIVLARDTLSLGNYLWGGWNPDPSVDVLTVWGAIPAVGVYDVFVSVAMPPFDDALGQLEITSITTDGAGYQDYELWATLDVVDGDWDLHGDFAIPGCLLLEQHLP